MAHIRRGANLNVGGQTANGGAGDRPGGEARSWVGAVTTALARAGLPSRSALVERHRVEVYLAAIARAKHEASREVILGGSVAELLEGRDHGADVDKRYDDVEVVVDPVLRTEERVDTTAAVEPQPYSALGERIDNS